MSFVVRRKKTKETSVSSLCVSAQQNGLTGGKKDEMGFLLGSCRPGLLGEATARRSSVFLNPGSSTSSKM
jgi:hypothetical protein